MQDATFIAMVLDRSGSMGVRIADTIAGFNTFLREQKALNKPARLTLAQFNTTYEIIHDNLPLLEAPELTRATFVPGGGTALYDAVGRTIDSVGARLAAMPTAQRPDKVVCVIITDGEENSSVMFSQARIREMIQHQTTHYAWQFVYLGADINSEQAAVDIGIARTNAVFFNNTAAGTSQNYGLAAQKLCAFRAGTSKTMEYTDDDKKFLADTK